MKENHPFNFNDVIEKQLMTEEDLEKVKAKAFVNLMSEMLVKYEAEIREKLILI